MNSSRIIEITDRSINFSFYKDFILVVYNEIKSEYKHILEYK